MIAWLLAPVAPRYRPLSSLSPLTLNLFIYFDLAKVKFLIHVYLGFSGCKKPSSYGLVVSN